MDVEGEVKVADQKIVSCTQQDVEIAVAKVCSCVLLRYVVWFKFKFEYYVSHVFL